MLQVELGVKVPTFFDEVDWDAFFLKLELRDLLDSLTIAYSVANRDGYKQTLRGFVERALREENLQYTTDEECGLHPYIDAAFQQARVSAIASLSEHGHGAALASYQGGMNALVNDDTLTAVRSVFDAAESVFKQEFGVARLGKSEIDKNLAPRLRAYYSDRASDAGGRLIAAFGEWVNGAHSYRHADGAPEPTPPPRELAVAFITAGTAWIRWMTDTNFLQSAST
ncbi:hypothetical protein [Phenylobacterium sp.]|uniref:hypothetical protein n=1 Tax=Phenylobacterium sp. TaxID=1871053 RepID=UPI0025DA1797|nr:hypothetical protein [Phenylobacterium sp.]